MENRPFWDDFSWKPIPFRKTKCRQLRKSMQKQAGHSELVHQMISGASMADMAILMVSAKEGIDKMSIGHLMLAEFLGIKKLIVGVNKMDAFDYSEEAFVKIKSELEKIL